MFDGRYTLEHINDAYNAFQITDTSSYANEPKEDFVTRRIYFQLIDGSYIQDADGNSFWDFNFTDFPDDYRRFDFLKTDVAFSISVVWVPIAPVDGSVYIYTYVYDFKDYLEKFAANLVLNMTTQKSLANIRNFMENFLSLQNCIDSANNRQEAQDQYSDQQAINAGTYLTNNLNLFY